METMTYLETINSAVNYAVGIANDDSHGYDQIGRWGPDYDCSSLVISAYRAAGLELKGATYTGNMRAAFIKDGFKSIPYKKGMSLFRGDVLMYHRVVNGKVHGHTVLYIGNNKIVQASINEKGKATGGMTRTLYTGGIASMMAKSRTAQGLAINVPAGEIFDWSQIIK